MPAPGAAKIIPADPEAIFLGYQEAWIKDTSRLKGMEKARQIGLSWSTAYRADETTAAAWNRLDTWVSSRDEIQARLFLEDCKMFAAIMSIVATDEGEKVIDAGGNTAQVLKFANGKRINSMSSNPDAQAGKRGNRILDEFALHPDQRKLWSIAYPGITWGGAQLEFISTHRGSHTFFNQLIREVREGGNPKKISLHRVTLENALDQGFLYKLQLSLPEGHEIRDMDEAEYFDFVRSGCADEEAFLQEYMCVPADDDSAFLEYGLITGCEYVQGEDWEIDLDTARTEYRQREYYAGLDIGRRKDLTVLWVFERLGDVLYTRKVLTLKNMSKPDQEKELWPWLELMRRTCVDYTGLGIGWGDDAQAQFGAHRVELVTFSARVKEELAYPVRGRMEDKRIRIPYDPAIRADFRAVTKVTTGTGNVRFTAERGENGHADRFWAAGLGIEAASTPADVMPEIFTRRRSGNGLAGYGGAVGRRDNVLRGY